MKFRFRTVFKLILAVNILSILLVGQLGSSTASALMPKADKLNFGLGGGFYSVVKTVNGCSENLTGNDNMSKIWSWLISKGMTPYGAAGIMGNMSVESGFNPFRIQGGAPLRTFDAMVSSQAYNSAFGLVQWDGGRRVQVLNTLIGQDVAYKQYVSDTYGKGAADYKNAPADVNDKVLLIELEFMFKEMNPGGGRAITWSKLLSAQSATAAANTFEEIFEGSTRTAGGPHVTAAETIYNQFKDAGGTISSDASCNGSGNLVSGGMTIDQAKSFMQKYIDFAKGKTGSGVKTVSYNGKSFNLYFSNCSGGPLANCSTFSEFFVGAYTSGKQAFPDGAQMVRELLATNSGFIDGGHTPKVYAVFSRASGGQGHGHTGVVLGIDQAKGKIIIGQAGCGADLVMNNYTVGEYSLASWTNNTDYTYAYTDNILLGGMN